MVELRWTYPGPGTTTKPPTLQWRSRAADPWGRLTLWTDWQDVPTVAVPKAAPTQSAPIFFQTALQAGLMAGDGKPCPNDHDPDCRWPQCNCRKVWA